MCATFGLKQVSISRSEAINLYVDIMKILYGKNTNLETLQKVGRINNKRNLEQKVSELKKYVKSQKERNAENRNDPFYFLNSYQSTLGDQVYDNSSDRVWN